MRFPSLFSFQAACLGCVLWASSARAQDTVEVSFPNSTVIEILHFYRANLTDQKIIVDSKVDTGIQFNVFHKEPMSLPEARDFIEAALLLEGLAFVPAGNDTLKLINTAAGKNLAVEGLPIFVDGQPIPEEEQVIAYVMRFQFISPEEAANAFKLVVQLHSYGAMAPMPNAAALVIVENTPVIRKLIQLKREIDQSSANIKTEFIKLQRADAERVAELVQEIMEISSSAPDVPARGGGIAPQSAPNNQANLPAAVGQALQTGSANASEQNTRVIADARTNRIFVVGREIDIFFVRKLVEEFDAPNESSNFVKKQLQHMAASDFLGLAADALGRGSLEVQDGNAGGRGNAGLGNASAGLGGNAGGAFGGNTNSGSNRGTGLTNIQGERPVPESIIVGKTLLIADNQLNTIIVSGSPEDVELVNRLAEELDVRPRQVLIRAIIGQLTLTNDRRTGFELLQVLNDSFIGSTNNTGTNADDGLASATGISELIRANDLSDSLAIYYRTGQSVATYLRLLESQRDFKLLANPAVFTGNNQPAVLSSGQQVPVPTSTVTSTISQDGSLTSNIGYREVVLELSVTPLISSEDDVTLFVTQINDNVIGSQSISGNDVPVISTQQLGTTVTVRDGGTIVLGGLIVEQETDEDSGVPFLVRVPLLRHLVGTVDKGIERREIMIFIQANIIDGPEELEREWAAEEILPRFGREDSTILPDLRPPEGNEAAESETKEEKEESFFGRMFGSGSSEKSSTGSSAFKKR
ncbi:MAG: secretin N-terminal domain-containing protein [Verrucomicrobiota bacterium]